MIVTAQPIIDIYLDTSIVFATMMIDSPHHRAARAFSDALIRAGSDIYISQFLPLELLQALRVLASEPRLLPEVTRRLYSLAQWGSEPSGRQRWFDECVAKFDGYLQDFANLFQIPLRSDDWRNSVALMSRHRTGPRRLRLRNDRRPLHPRQRADRPSGPRSTARNRIAAREAQCRSAIPTSAPS